MATKAGIKTAILGYVAPGKFTLWRIGLTHNWTKRKSEWADAGHDVKHWHCWEADSLYDAQDLETHFINEKGMKGGTGGDLSSNKAIYVYIF